MPRSLWVVVLATGIAGVAMTMLIAGLPADGFFTGDAGVKLIAARNALAHPRRPFDIDLPTIGGRPVALVDPMIVPHDAHAHVLQSPVFPVVSAPLIATFGLRGAYILSAVSFVLMVPLLEAMRRMIVPTAAPHVVAVLALVANPLFFYSLEFWEHAPAVVLVAACTAVTVRLQADAARTGGARAASGLLAGALAGLAVLFRPEAALYLIALGIAFPPAIDNVIALAAGAIIVLAPLSIASYVHSGSFMGPHLINTLTPLLYDWLADRGSRMRAWLWPDSIWEALAVVTIAAAWMTRPFRVSLQLRQALALGGVAWLSILAADRGLDRNSLWQAFPVAALALVPVTPTIPLRRLQLMTAITAALIILTATHDGGAQWGPRFLLVITPPAILLASIVLADVIGAGAWRSVRVTLTLIIVLGALLTTRAAYREIRGAKTAYARIVDATASLTKPSEPIVTTVWWFDQIAAPLYGTRTFLYTPDSASAATALRDLEASRQREATLVWTKEPDGVPLDSATHGTCYRVVDVRAIAERELVFTSASCQ